MFADFVQWISGRATEKESYDHAFLREVSVKQTIPPDRKVERFILRCWIAIAVKHVAVIWAVSHYRMPFHQLLVNAPTWIFALIATIAYYCRRE
jgi:hypothetical protein